MGYPLPNLAFFLYICFLSEKFVDKYLLLDESLEHGTKVEQSDKTGGCVLVS